MENREEWKEVTGYEGCYKISNLGRVLSIKRHGTRGGIISLVMDKDGYFLAHLSLNGVASKWRVHEIVANEFIGEPASPSLQVNHINCVKTDNRPLNLEWCTAKENIVHAHKNGRCNQGCEKNNNSKINNEIAVSVFRSNGKHCEIAEKYKISQALVSSIKRGESWAKETGAIKSLVPIITSGEKNSNSKITEDQAKEIFYSKGRYRDIGILYGISGENVYRIKNGKSWKYLGLKKSA